MWVAGTSQLKDGAEFLGSTSDEFPLFHVNIVISKGTASGIYDVQFLTRETVGANEAPTQLTSNKSKEFPTELVGTSIAVGVDSVAVTDSQQDNVQFYTDSNTNIIRATDFASKILADVTYTDGTTEWTSPVWWTATVQHRRNSMTNRQRTASSPLPTCPCTITANC